MIVSLSSVAGAPGVTSWSLLLGAAWPKEYGVERVVVEAARDGGVLGARYPDLGVEPGVATLAAAARRRNPGEDLPLQEFARLVGDGLWVVPAPESAEAAMTVWSPAAATVATALAADRRVWLVDAGRSGPGSPGLALSAMAALTVVLSGASREDLLAVPARVQALQGDGTAVAVVLVGPTPYQLDELRGFFRTGLVFKVPAQRDLVAWTAAVVAGGRARRSWLWRQAVTLAAELAERVSTANEVPVADGDRGQKVSP